MIKSTVLDHNPRIVRRNWERTRVQTEILGESRTQQSHRDSVDVNQIVAKFDRTGQLPPNTKTAQYGDVSDLNAPYSELIEKSRETLDTAGQFIETLEMENNEKTAAALAAEKLELEELRKSKLSPPPQPT